MFDLYRVHLFDIGLFNSWLANLFSETVDVICRFSCHVLAYVV